jgi:hypothetical protein
VLVQAYPVLVQAYNVDVRKSVLIAAFLMVATALPLCAQHRGFAAGRGQAFAGGHAGRRVVVNGGFGVRGGVGFGRNPRFGVFVGSRPFHHRRSFRPYGFGYPYYPYYSAYPYSAYPYYGIGLQSDFVYANGEVPQYDSPAYMAEHDSGLQNDLYRLQAELDEIKQQQAAQAADRQQYALNTPAATPRAIPAAPRRQEAPAPLTVLVFRDGHKTEVHNYAVTGQTLWIFSEERARKVPLAELDLDATRAANEERGLDFAVQPKPSASPR